MQIKTGVDLLVKERFMTSVTQGGRRFLEKVFTPYELRENSDEQLASIFCLKEAVIKTFELPPDSWLSISTSRMGNGKLTCSLTELKIAANIMSLDTSISHEQKMIIAVVVAIIENK